MRRLLTLLLGSLALLAGVAVVTLAAPGVEECVAQATGGDPDLEERIACPGGAATDAPGTIAAGTPGSDSAGPALGAQPVCTFSTRLRAVTTTPRGRGVRFGFQRRGGGPVTVELFRVSRGARVLVGTRVARFPGRERSFTWSGRGRAIGDGTYVARFRAAGAGTRRVALRRRAGRFAPRPAFERSDSCGALRSFKLERPVFGGTRNRALGVAYRVSRASRVTVTVTRAGRTVRRYATVSGRPGRTYRLRLGSRAFRRGDHQVRIAVRPAGAAAVTARLTAARL